MQKPGKRNVHSGFGAPPSFQFVSLRSSSVGRPKLKKFLISAGGIMHISKMANNIDEKVN